MGSYLPGRKVVAAALMASVATVYLVASGQATLEAVSAAWMPVAVAYSVRG